MIMRPYLYLRVQFDRLCNQPAFAAEGRGANLQSEVRQLHHRPARHLRRAHPQPILPVQRVHEAKKAAAPRNRKAQKEAKSRFDL